MSEPGGTVAAAAPARLGPADAVRDAFLEALRSGSRRQALAVVERGRSDGLGLADFYLQVFQPALREVGRLWQENLLTVAEEHLATAITQAAMLQLYADQPLPPGGGRTLVAACAETEQHHIGLRMVCDFLDLAGWDTFFLGPSVPRDALVRMIRERAPDAVALSASIHPHLPQLAAVIAEIREAAGDRQPTILVGGRPFLESPELAATIGADLTAEDAAGAAQALVARLP